MTDSLAPGTKVLYEGTGEPEYGVVLHCWVNEEVGVHDCYVAFFGNAMPTGTPAEPPYVLRYFARSLTVIE